VDSVESARAALAGGADRLELCDNLVEGGTTPSAGTIAVCVAKVALPVFVLVRPRGGDFVYDETEAAVMLRDVATARELGALGIVTGALTAPGDVDEPLMRALVDAAGPLPVTFHRAFDVCRDRDAALATLLRLGVRRVLTSGGAATALDGAPEIHRLSALAGDRLAILAGGGVNESNARELVLETGVREIHVRCADQMVGRSYGPGNPAIRFRRMPDLAETARLVTDAGRISRVREAVTKTGS
jgi:copper homeostasis protein